jgi:hypothetical protein
MTNDPVAGWDPVTLHKHNIGKLGRRDILVAGDPGAGNALIGNIMLELGYDYLDPYTEVVAEDGSASPAENQLSYRQRMAATAAHDQAGAAPEPPARRFVKTHLYPEMFADAPLGGVLLLVRDPRDTIYSGFQWFRGFAKSWWDDVEDTRGKGTLLDFLRGTRIGDGRTPVAGWSAFYEHWLAAAPALDRLAVVRFEDVKTDPVPTVTAMLAAFGLTASVEQILRAVERSSFDAMRAHEDQVSAAEGESRTKDARIMRRGRIGEWQEWIGEPGVAEQFADPDLINTAARFGYPVAPVPTTV